MPATAEKHEIDYREKAIVDSRVTKGGASTRTAPPVRWIQMQSLVEHFGDAAVAEPATRPRRKSRVATPEFVPVETPETPHPATKTAARRAVRHQRIQFRPTAVVMWCTVLGLLLILLGLHGTTLALSRKDTGVASKIRLSQEAIDNSNKSIAAIQVSPQTAQWALAHGWHLADQGDFDEVPPASNSRITEVAP